MRPIDERYFDGLESRLEEVFAVANTARKRGSDPAPTVEIPIAKDMADRVENLLGIPGVASRVRELEAEMTREEAALVLAADFAAGTVGDDQTREGKIEGAVRTAVALLTEGVVAAPIEGIDGVELSTNDDGSEFVRVYYAGPIRSAGGTAQALSVLVADYTRTLLGVGEYQPRQLEVERYAEEVALYDAETGLQYSPTEQETKFIATNCPVCLDGEATGDEEVSGFRDLDRVHTNKSRGGMCLVLAEGIALKAPKIKRYTGQLDEVDWPWLDDLIEGSIGDAGNGHDETREVEGSEDDRSNLERNVESTSSAGPPRVEPTGKYLRDLIAGRPVFSHPSRPGGFRLRYGRARNHGFATAGVHPATMHLVDDFLATGTQIKTERPGKAAGVVPVDSIDGPTVRLRNGEVRRIDDPAEALEIRHGVERILDLGEYLLNVGEFVENNHPLAPASYVFEWWIQEFTATEADVQALADDPHVDLRTPTPEEAVAWARSYDCPLHPAYTYLWHDISVADFDALADAVDTGEIRDDTLHIVRTGRVRSALESLLIEHVQGADELRIPDWVAFVHTLGFEVNGTTLLRTWTELSEAAREWGEGDNAVAAANEVAPFSIRERAPTRIGNRMGRPEKSEKRELNPTVHTLFPLGEAGGDQRDVVKATRYAPSMSDVPGEIEVELGQRLCIECDAMTFRQRCSACGGSTIPSYECDSCGRPVEPGDGNQIECHRCDRSVSSVERQTIDLDDIYHDALERLGEREHSFSILKGVKGLTSSQKTPEPIEKGILRAKHGVSTFKDGTVRYDMTDLPVTAVRPAELDVTVDRFRELGYHEDIHGEPLSHDDQLVELRVQDIVLSDGAAAHLIKTAGFVDDLLERFYDLAPFYNVDERDDLVGELVLGMAPHTSAAVVGRVVGFTSASVGYAHPYFHASKRRNCFHPATEVWYRDEQGAWRTESIETLVETRLDAPREDDHGALVQEVDHNIVVPSIDSSGVVGRNRIQTVSKHLAPNHLVEIETQSGRSITVTPDHSMLRWRDEIERIDAMSLEPGDELVVATAARSFTNDVPTSSIAADGGRPIVDSVTQVTIIPTDVDYTYCLTVEDTHALVANGIYTGQCDGDEDCVMLLLDGLLNFSRAYLPEKRGGSVAEQSRLLAFDADDRPHFLAFDTFWEVLDSPIETDGKFRKKTCIAEGWKTFTFDENHRASLKPIEKAIRYRSCEDDSVLRVETQFGRHLEITDHHSLFRYDDGIEEVAGADLRVGDLIVAPRHLDIEHERMVIDVVEHVEDPYVFIDGPTDSMRSQLRNGPDSSRTTPVAFDGGSSSLSTTKVPFTTFEPAAVGRRGQDTGSPDVSIGTRASTTGISRHIAIDSPFAWLLGFVFADGSLQNTTPTLRGVARPLVDRIVKAAKSSFDAEPSVRPSNGTGTYDVTFSRVFCEVLCGLGVIELGSNNPGEQAIPKCMLVAPREVILSFIRGFIAGDGAETADSTHPECALHTDSADVRDGLIFLLHRLGIVAHVSPEEATSARQSEFTITISCDSSHTPLQQLLNGDQLSHPNTLFVTIPDALLEIREREVDDIETLIPPSIGPDDTISLERLRTIVTELDDIDLPNEVTARLDDIRPLVDGDLSYLRVTSIERVEYDGYLYDLQVGGSPIFAANWLYAHNSMDAPLVMSSRIDPAEIDDEAHNMDVVDHYPLALYQATLEMGDPNSIDMNLAGDSIGTDAEYTGFLHTHDTSNIALGPDLSAYKTLGSMMDKMESQLELARKLRAVDETDVAERVIEYHFLPDIIGNLRAFSRQEMRCHTCGTKYRRAPLSRSCRECGGDVNLTVHRGSVNKYMDAAIDVAKQYECREYTKQRLALLETTIESVFENDQNKQSGIADFM